MFKIGWSFLVYNWCKGEKCWSLGNSLYSLLLGSESQTACHLEKIILLRVGKMSEEGIGNNMCDYVRRITS